jgi:hypothetical protein
MTKETLKAATDTEILNLWEEYGDNIGSEERNLLIDEIDNRWSEALEEYFDMIDSGEDVSAEDLLELLH